MALASADNHQRLSTLVLRSFTAGHWWSRALDHGGTYDALLDAGVRIYEWQPTTLHAKTFVVDGEWSAIGSMNFDQSIDGAE